MIARVFSGALLFSVALFAQTDRATITGAITDQSGAVVPGATVKAVQTGTNLERTTQTTAQGDVILTAGSTVRSGAPLAAGQVSESIGVGQEAGWDLTADEVSAPSRPSLRQGEYSCLSKIAAAFPAARC